MSEQTKDLLTVEERRSMERAMRDLASPADAEAMARALARLAPEPPKPLSIVDLPVRWRADEQLDSHNVFERKAKMAAVARCAAQLEEAVAGVDEETVATALAAADGYSYELLTSAGKLVRDRYARAAIAAILGTGAAK